MVVLSHLWYLTGHYAEKCRWIQHKHCMTQKLYIGIS